MEHTEQTRHLTSYSGERRASLPLQETSSVNTKQTVLTDTVSNPQEELETRQNLLTCA